MDKSEIINRLIKEIGATSYLEVGIGNLHNFNLVECENKIGVDPNVEDKLILQLTSDDFFKGNEVTYDVIFLDGWHEDIQVRKDINNSLKCLSKDGCIIIHDSRPHTKEMQEVPRVSKQWTGTVWKAVVGFHQKYPNVRLETYKSDFGLTCIYPNGFKSKAHFEKIEMSFGEFKANEVELLNIIGD